VEGSQGVVGFRVDSVSEVLRIPADTVEPPPAAVASLEDDYIRGVGKLKDKLLMLIDLEGLMQGTYRDIGLVQKSG
jgi:purine-binding chemotaxis protein CheW